VHDFDANQNDTRAVEVFEPQHRSSSTFDGPMVLLDYVVQILDLTNLDGCLALRVHRMQCRQIRTAFVDGHRLRRTVLSDCLFKETPGSNLVALGSEQKIDGVTRLVYGAIQLFPRTFDLDIGFIHAPALAHRALVLAKRLFKQRHQLDDPPMHR
jgi:hypothetical protein